MKKSYIKVGEYTSNFPNKKPTFEIIYNSTLSKVKEKILEINPNYKFILEDALNEGNGKTMKGWDLVAYIE